MDVMESLEILWELNTPFDSFHFHKMDVQRKGKVVYIVSSSVDWLNHFPLRMRICMLYSIRFRAPAMLKDHAAFKGGSHNNCP